MAEAGGRPGPGLCCIGCGGRLADEGDELGCPACGRRFEVVAGIADLRPPLAGFDAARDRGLALELEAARHEGFVALLSRYWRAQPDVDPRLARRFIDGDVIGAARAAEVLGQVEELAGPLEGTTALELGCGTAALGCVLAQRAGAVVVSDVALAWLVLARHRLQEAGVENATVVACAADSLPFAAGSFDIVVAADVIEHVPDAAGLVTAAFGVLTPGGRLWLSTPNRFSLTPEPHVRLLGVGWLPRRVAVAYVRRARGAEYGDVRTLSLRALRRVLATTGGEVRVIAPGIAGAVRAGYGPLARSLIDAYDVVRRLPLVGVAVRAVSPLFHATLGKPGSGG